MTQIEIEPIEQDLSCGFGKFVVKSIGVNVKEKLPNGAERTAWLTLESPDLAPIHVAVPTSTVPNPEQPANTLAMGELEDVIKRIELHVLAGIKQ